MIVKSFTANTVAGALKKVRSELGGDAVILKTKRLQPDQQLVAGAKVEEVIGSHYPRMNFSTSDHWDTVDHPMEFVGAVPLLVEALISFPTNPGDTAYENSWWNGSGALANRHLKGSGRVAVSNVVYTDGHAESYRLPGLPENVKNKMINQPKYEADFSANEYFHADAICIQKRSGKWATMRSCNENPAAFGFMGFSPPANVSPAVYPPMRGIRDEAENWPFSPGPGWHKNIPIPARLDHSHY